MPAQILLIENEIKIAKFLELDLNDEGYQVGIAYDGVTGLETAKATQPDLVILDWNLPGLNGLEVCRHLRSAGSNAPIIFISAISSRENHIAGLKAGANDYMVKPFSTEELLAKITNYL
ncbi:MAG: response regulator transcription factor [Pseudanabaenales cyanobacterium]|nr:response regulator transcription factor [Pseudanabaenales cyanobacterium]